MSLRGGRRPSDMGIVADNGHRVQPTPLERVPAPRMIAAVRSIPNGDLTLLPWRRRRRPRRGRLLRRGHLRSRGGRGRRLRLGFRLWLRRRLDGGCLLLPGRRFLKSLGRRRRRRQLDRHRIGPHFRHPGGGRNRFDICRFRLITVERKDHGQGRIGRQSEGTRCAAGLPIGGLGIGARRRRLESHGIHYRSRFQCVEIYG